MDKLEIKEVHKSFGKRLILNQIQLECGIGETIGIFGRNGSGKSTLFKIMFGVLKADQFQGYVNNKAIHSNAFAKKMIGYLPQDGFLPGDIKVRDLIAMVHPNGDVQNRIFYAPGVHSFDHKWVGLLSAGELKYLEFLLVCFLDHPFLLLDEPFSMIDPLYHEVIKEIIQTIGKTKGILLTDHYYEDVLQVTSRNFVLKNGDLIPIESRKDLARYGYIPS